MPALPQPSILGQLPLGFYTQVLLGFSLPRPADLDAAVHGLTTALRPLVASFPLLAGQVVLEGKTATSSGAYRVVPREPNAQLLTVKDCSSSCARFADLVATKAPDAMLDGALLAPMKGLPEAHDAAATPLPVFLLQVNVVDGGVILCSACMHQALDMNGQAQVLRLLAQACAGQAFSREDVAAGNLGGEAVVPLLRDGETALEHANFRCASRLGVAETASSSPSPPETPAPAPWTYFRFTRANLVRLKAEATPAAAPPGHAWISTNDALTAFLWQRIARARAPRFAPATTTFCDRLVNIRSRLRPAVPQGYLGHMLILDQIPCSFAQMAAASLPELARALRDSLRTIDDHHVRSAATLITRAEDKSTFQYGANADGRRDLTVSSWAGLELAELDFGPVLGTAAFVRRANTAPCEGLAYLMPVSRTGDVDVGVSLRDADGEALARDEVWRGFAERIG